ncbi:LacI family DNA-binding transcriptional regulator [Pseudarthrobacter sp. AL07]|uniref:LacI family DNA-binding transcriptional regulator n=1 Tax=unclassified Pseudarthrobacter TaxID=2647000 RepID=UPI00249A5ABE|nr:MULTISPECIES: LacI family DNA-binding transcriptional regulator [unclassified Pseudarthrobacter]MDI3193577.1 LacI family DNA-binding transcriptional regulator [Pseudarthrobacter sp. AL20]MDI3207913.1 LacI family DNA-binding transcriptional regulator [Pseudarthrobacter sp. AL07]
MNRKATALDVAKLAGVSRSAVSLVLNGHGDGNVAKESQVRIREAAATLNYTPNAIAVSLRNRRSRIIGIVSDQVVTSPFDGNIIAGADAVARSQGFVTVVMDTELDEARDESAVATLLDRQVDGLMYVTVGLRPLHVPLNMLRVPSVLANCFDDRPGAGVPAVIPDEVRGGREAATHLLGLGHRDIAFLAGDSIRPAAPRRIQGHRDAFEAAGLPVRPGRILEAGWDIDAGFHGAMKLLDGVAAPDRPTAIMCANDRLAIGVVLAANRLGLAIPQDLSIMGYDDEFRIAATMVPALTTMALPLREMGAAAMTGLLRELSEEPEEPEDHDDGGAPAGHSSPGQTMVPCRLVVRESTGAVPAGRA